MSEIISSPSHRRIATKEIILRPCHKHTAQVDPSSGRGSQAVVRSAGLVSVAFYASIRVGCTETRFQTLLSRLGIPNLQAAVFLVLVFRSISESYRMCS